MRAFRNIALMGAASLALGASFGSALTHHAPGPIILGGGALSETEEERRRRNLAAGGRDKRIHRNKARRSMGTRRTRTTPLGFSNPFTKKPRKDAFEAALTAGETRNMAAKLARRVSA